MEARWKRFTKEELQAIFESSKSYKEIAEKLGYAYGGGALQIIKDIAKQFNFSLHLQTKTKEQINQERNEIIGKQFGRLTVLSLDEEKTKTTHRTYFTCQCNCKDKTIVSVRYDGLISKERPTLSCGCLQKEAVQKTGISLREDLTNQHFGHLTVLSYDEIKSDKYKRPHWLCKCDCGSVISVAARALKSGQQSCGCLRSNGEHNVKTILTKLNINFVSEYSDIKLTGRIKPLHFDFYLPDYNICIECQGQQHYQEVEFFGGEEQFKLQQEYDSLKRDYCKSHNIKLIEIPYWDYDIIDEDYILKLINS